MESKIFRLMIAISLLLAGGTAARAATAGRAGAYKIHVETQPEDPVVGRNEVRVHVADAGGQAVLGAHVTVAAEMEGMEMTIQPVTAMETGGGVYAAPITLSMAGQWRLKVAVHGPAGAETAVATVTARDGASAESATSVSEPNGAAGGRLSWLPITGGVVVALVVIATLLRRKRDMLGVPDDRL